MKKKAGITAEELMSELNSDPAYLARQAELDRSRQKLWDEWARAEIPLVESLGAVGVSVESVWDLVNRTPTSYPAAVPVLMEHINRDYPDRIREGILRALSTPDARNRWKDLVQLFEHNTANLSQSIRYVAALALSGAANDSVIDDVIRLARDPGFGFDRAPLLLALRRSADSRAKMLLLELRNDPDLGKEVKRLRRLTRGRASQT